MVVDVEVDFVDTVEVETVELVDKVLLFVEVMLVLVLVLVLAMLPPPAPAGPLIFESPDI